jgi:hypothetical protein
MLDQLKITPEKRKVDVLSDCKIYDIDGKCVPQEICKQASSFFAEVLESVQNKLNELRKSGEDGGIEQLSLGQIFRTQFEMHSLYGELSEAHKRLIHWLIANLEYNIRADLNQVSASIPVELKDEYEYAVPGGLGQIPHALAYGIGPDDFKFDIRCECPVDTIVYKGSGIGVQAGARNFESDIVVLAVPITSLQVSENLTKVREYHFSAASSSEKSFGDE